MQWRKSTRNTYSFHCFNALSEHDRIKIFRTSIYYNVNGSHSYYTLNGNSNMVLFTRHLLIITMALVILQGLLKQIFFDVKFMSIIIWVIHPDTTNIR